MATFNARRYWWVVVSLAVVAGIAAAELLDPNQGLLGGFILFSSIGASFCWAYTVDRERLWWAIIPGLIGFTLLAATIVGSLIETNTENNWVAILVAGIGTLLTGVVVQRFEAKVILYIVAWFTIIIGVAYIPVAWVIKGVIIAGLVLSGIFLMWTNREAMSAGGRK